METIEVPLKAELSRLSACALLEGYAQGRFTPVDVVEEVIGNLSALQDSLNVIVTDMFDAARASAREAAAAWRAGKPTGPLCGVPVTVKDLIYVRDVRGCAGAPALADFVPTTDSAPVERLRTAGAVLTCKTTTCESGYKLTADSPLTGITRNPWDPSRTAGGSSGGAAAAVAAGGGPLALGTDGVGSIRVPSSFCGVFGLKPTFGLVPRSPGFFPPSWASLAHTGPITRTVADAALMLSVLAGHDARDAGSLPVPGRSYSGAIGAVEGLRIGYAPDLGGVPVEPVVAELVRKAVDRLVDADSAIEIVKPVLGSGLLEEILHPIALTEQAAAADGRDEKVLALSEPEYRAVIERGRGYRGVDYITAGYRRGQLRENFRQLFEAYDLLITPTVAVAPFRAGTIGVDKIDGQAVDQHLGWSPFTWPMNLAGLPAATLPCGFTPDGLPVGLQLVAPWLEEQQLLAFAAFIEQVLPWGDVWPDAPRRL